MKRCFILITVIFICLQFSGCIGGFGTKPEVEAKTYSSEYFTIQQLGDGVFAAITPEDKNCNAGIVDMGDTALVIDAFISIESAEDLKKAAETLTGNKVGYVINTHPHADHITGNEVFADNATIICTKPTSAAVKLPEGKGKIEIFEKEKIIKGSKRSVRVIEIGAAHSVSDSVVYLPDDKIVFMGDMKYVLAAGLPSIFEESVNNLIAMNGSDSFNGVVWGHGPGTKNDIRLLSKYFTWSKAAVKDVLENNGTVDQVLDIPLPEEFTWDKEVVKFRDGYLRFLYMTMTREKKK